MATKGGRRKAVARPRQSRRGGTLPRTQYFQAPARHNRWTPLLAAVIGVLATIAAARLISWLAASSAAPVTPFKSAARPGT